MKFHFSFYSSLLLIALIDGILFIGHKRRTKKKPIAVSNKRKNIEPRLVVRKLDPYPRRSILWPKSGPAKP